MNRFLQGIAFLLMISAAPSAWAQATYCIPPTQCGSSADPAIAGVKFGAISTTTTCGGYTLFPETANNTTTVERSATYRATVQFRGTYSWFGTPAEYAQLGFIYIDFNADGDFSTNEIFTVSGRQSSPGTIDITIPARAVLGKTRMRVRHRVVFAPEPVMGPCEHGLNGDKMAYETEDYTITIVEANAGIPACPTTSSPANAATNVTRNPDYTFTWAGATGGKNTTYDLLLGESATALASIAADIVSPDGHNGSFVYTEFLNQSTPYYYRVQPKNVHGINTECPVRKFTTAPTANRYYCTPAAACMFDRNGSQTEYYYIKGLNLNTLNTTSACTGNVGAYTLFPAATTTTLTKGTTYIVTAHTLAETFLSGGSASGYYPKYGGCSVGYVSVWIDFNQNGNFNDPGEFFALSQQTSESTHWEPGACIGPIPTTSIAIPPQAISGATRMRVRANLDAPLTATDACTNISRGETEDYTITIAAAANCAAMKVDVAKTDDNSITPTPSGSITLTPSGGTAPYTATWQGGNTGSLTGMQATGITKGVYYNTVTDASGCVFTNGPIYITKPQPLKVSNLVTINPACDKPGKIVVSVTGGVGPYTFQWNDPQLYGNFLDNVAEGTYQAVITDSRGATITTGPLQLTTLAYGHTKREATCATNESGEITLAVRGGSTPYTYHWENNRGETVYMNRPTIPTYGKTTYTATITDATGCALVTSPIYVDGPDTIKVTPRVIPINCNGTGNTTGEISLTSKGGQGAYRYEIFSPADYYTPLPLTFVEDASGFRFTEVLPDESGYPYSILSYDNNNCASKREFVAVDEIQSLDPTWGYQEVCAQEPTLLTFLGYMPDMKLTWYADAEATQTLGTGRNLMAPALTQPINYYLVNEQYGCRSNIIAFQVNPLSLPPQPAITHTGGAVLCGSETIALSAPAGFQGYEWSTGNITRMLTVSEAGTYTVIVRNKFGCHSPASDPVVITKITGAPQPEIASSGPTAFCPGGSTTLSATEGYTNYLWTDGVTTRTRTVTQPGSYSVSVSNSATCSSDPSAPVVITMLPLPTQPVISITGSPAFCTGGSAELSAPEGFTQYRWSDGITTRTRTVTQHGNYSVQVNGANGCKSVPSTSITIEVWSPPAQPVITTSASTAFCPGGGEVELFAPEGYNAYRWSNGATTASIVVTQAGSYSVVVMADCESPASEPIIIQQGVAPEPPQQLLLRSDNTLQALGGGMMYEWRLNDVVLPETGNRLSLAGQGVYEVRSMSSEGCVSAEGLTYVYLISAVEAPSIAELRVFPKPSTGSLTLQTNTSGQARIRLINTQGVVVQQITVNLADQTTLDLHNLPAGLYYLVIDKDHQSVTHKITLLPNP